ncbi:Calpain catalytic subunit [Lachnellula occidentalis]|uniref:Calpain catalytic subunit n=1 Tax=Lachnellula occidentalis TaxID=215460 RepID=A0A8H8RUC1_9HELO|nr:Calpain catalytic subunit [Lachnellula occidentalis]
MSSTVDSSDSDNDTPKTGPPPFGGKPKSKKKKKTLPPQETINKIWKRFSARKFSKATVLLPFVANGHSRDPSKKLHQPSIPERTNLLVSEDFERAVQECRSRVKKLVKECKRVNMRYRDPDFDIDWDLKWEKGYCLNGLGGDRFEVNGRAFTRITSNVPKAVKRVHEIFEEPTFLKDKISPADVKQGSIGDCWLLAALTALANMEVGIRRICVEYDRKIGIYGFVFHRDGEWIISVIDDKLYLKSPDWDSPSVQRHLLEQTDREDVEKEYRKTYQTGSQALFFAHCKTQNETWLPLLEKAYAKAHGDYAALNSGWIGEGVEDLTGGVTTELLTSDILDTDEFWKNEILKVNKEFLFGCSTGLLDGGYGNREGITEGHAYVIMEARELSSGQRLLKLRNPWGKGKIGNWEGAWSDGSKEFTPEAQKELNHQFGNDSVFWISYQDLLRKYQHFDRTRLFMDSPDWRITQKWISVEVPWKAEFEQKFRIVLKKESPVVLVLSQLDDRYFDGLQGQYIFRLQFRLHEVDSPDEEDYIVRSHGNYLMERSVVTELKSLPAGTYSVFIMVVADRDLTQSTIEDVIKEQCKQKVDNDKLAQVGMSYDIAHSKGAVHMESRAAARKTHDKLKARESRIATRRKNWEKRHLSRRIVRKQEKKNREKRERKEAEDAAHELEEEDEEDKPKDKAMQTEDPKEVRFEKEDKAIQTEDPNAVCDETSTSKLPASKENDKGVQTDNVARIYSDSQGTPETPKSSSVANSPRQSVRIPTYAGGPPGPPPPIVYTHHSRKASMSQRNYLRAHPHQYAITSDGESSASPISEFDDMYSDDDPTLKPRPINTGGAPSGTSKSRTIHSDDEDETEPWNAVCIVGFRVYSKDEGLEVKIFGDGNDEEVVDIIDEGSEADVEDDGEKKQHLVGEGASETKDTKGEEPSLPIRSKEEEELALVDGEKKACSLAANILRADQKTT